MLLADGTGCETDDIIDEIAKQPRTPSTPLLLAFSPADNTTEATGASAGDDSQQSKPASDGDVQVQGATRHRLLKWADDNGTGSNVEEEVPSLDMFGGDGTTTDKSNNGGTGSGIATKPKVVPFHLRQAAERAAFAAVQEQARAKRARLETVRTIHSRQEMQAAEAAAYAEEERQNRARADAKANAALAAEAARPKKWGLKRSRDGEDAALNYGGATIPIANPK